MHLLVLVDRRWQWGVKLSFVQQQPGLLKHFLQTLRLFDVQHAIHRVLLWFQLAVVWWQLGVMFRWATIIINQDARWVLFLPAFFMFLTVFNLAGYLEDVWRVIHRECHPLGSLTQLAISDKIQLTGQFISDWFLSLLIGTINCHRFSSGPDRWTLVGQRLALVNQWIHVFIC